VNNTTHEIIFDDASSLNLPNNSIDLVVTSPPYPMVEMWDEQFNNQNPNVKIALDKGNTQKAFEIMHTRLDRVWEEVFRVLKKGGMACINIGDATRTIKGKFQLFSNHTRVLQCLINLGFDVLPMILWRKQTNAPNKFMGSGMLPTNAYITLEHEYILIVRKGPKRVFKDKEKRYESGFFWEERNIWFSDMWTDIKGVKQNLGNNKSRNRSGAFPFELAYRLINMFSIKDDIVLDPFLGTGTTTSAAIASRRNSIGYEIDKKLSDKIADNLYASSFWNGLVNERLKKHIEFAKNREENKGPLKYKNKFYVFPVITKQEVSICFDYTEYISQTKNIIKINHTPAILGE
jgi:DNA modification methylase